MMAVRTVIVGSPEYFKDRSGSTNSGYLSAIYTDFLGRSVDASGQATWGGDLNNGVSREFVALGVLRNPEGVRDLVQSFYTLLLSRNVDSSGLTTFATDIGQGAAEELVIAGIASSDEFFNL
jgi:hypothetical protein